MKRRLACLLCIFLLLVLTSGGVAQASVAGLVGYWTLDEESGLTAADSSGNGYDGTLSGDLHWQPTGGRWGGALLYGGENTAHVEVSAAGMSASAGSVMMWGNLTEPQPSQTRYFFGHTTQPSYGNRIQLYMDGSNTELDLGLGGAHATRTNIAVLQTQQWYHVAFTWDNGSYVVYLDGEVAATGSYSGLTAIHDFVWIGNDGNPVSEGVEAFGGLLDEVAICSRALTQEEIQYVMNGGLRQKTTATGPRPEDGATDVRRDATLGWIAGMYAATHDVYFGTVQADVEAADRGNPMGVLVSQGQNDVVYDPAGLLEIGQTYYWRIDEVNAAPDSAVYKGDVWSFTAEPMAYAVQGVIATSNTVAEEGLGPERTVDGSGLNDADQHSTAAGDMWLADAPEDEPIWIQFEFDKVYKLHELLVWNYNVMFEPVLGFGFKDVTIESSINGVDWTVVTDAQFARATARADYVANTAIALEGVAAKFVRVTAGSAWGTTGQFGLSEVRFMYIPVQARQPQPADGAVDVDPAAGLSWRAGREAISHEVYFGTDQNDLPLAGSPAQAAFTPAALDFGTTYYWRVDEVGDDDVWAGDLWSFAMQEFALIDGFETYTDDIDAGEAIFDTWLDGWVNNTGSTVGYITAPFAEKTIVHSGSQSMPLQYDNTGSPFYSEAERQFASPQDWTVNGADTLRLFVAGEAPAFVESADGAIVMNGIGNDIWDNADQFRYAHKNLSGNGSITARVEYLDASANSWVKVGVMIRQNAEAGAINVFMALTGGDGGGATFQQRMTAGGASVSQHTYEDGPLAPPYWVRVTREGNTLQGYTSPDGETWTPRGDTITLAMTDPVLIGLAVTSHNADQATSAEFSNVAFTGNVTGDWQVAEIGVAQPAGNAIAPLYVALEDTAGGSAVVTHPDANIVGRSGWTEWQIPLSDLDGVNLRRIDTMAIGIGSRTNPTAGGTGIVFIDDVAFGRPVAVE
ncbi:MAG: discoidin domain-containing protein [Planctomycetota bacterium]|nr:discoidin domain-containing protein [Planctomycetota bacterium]